MLFFFFFFFNDTATTEIYTLSLHDALPISVDERTALVATSHVYFTSGAIQDIGRVAASAHGKGALCLVRSEEHTSELQSLAYLVCRLLLEKKKKNKTKIERLATYMRYTPTN